MKHQFAENPFPDVHVSEVERLELIQLVDGYVDDYVKKYEEFVNVEKRKVDKRRWDRIKSKDNIHWNAEEIARDQILVYEAYKSDDGCSYAACTVSSEMSFLESTTSVYGHESWQDI
ncbi:hypothetical protein PR002_g26047 [Phytophthora rubi]|uniref:Uncharacterized protein n=1 Tax=Phytophthora rubi TaxID=129364 RepID=A0A6A3HTD0_9STRA|nr:hypothetical protein PR002_g26047 [Phytophthora rubi]